jgi:hypothetical protein
VTLLSLIVAHPLGNRGFLPTDKTNFPGPRVVVKRLPQSGGVAPEPKKKLTFRYSVYGTVTDEGDNPLESDEFQKFICGTPTTVAKNDTYWNPIN